MGNVGGHDPARAQAATIALATPKPRVPGGPLSKSTDIAVPDRQKFLDYLEAQAATAPDGTEITERIMAATTVDDVLSGASSELTKAENILGVPLMILSVRFNASDFALTNPLGAYAVMDCVTTQGEKRVVSCGSETVMAQLYRLITMDALPVHVQINRTERATKSGFHPMSLSGAKKAFEAGF